jgi:hypothetical protein
MWHGSFLSTYVPLRGTPAYDEISDFHVLQSDRYSPYQLRRHSRI